MLKLPKAIADSLTIETRSLNTSSLFLVIWDWSSFPSSCFILREVERNILKKSEKVDCFIPFLPSSLPNSPSENAGGFIFWILGLEIVED